jgi:hypothetical protein
MNWKLLTDGKELLAVEAHDDNTVTAWGYSVWGAIGSRGKPKDGTCLRDPKNRRERDLIATAQRLHDRAKRSGDAMATAMLAAKHD